MILLYNFSIFIYSRLIRLVALFNTKAALWVSGRKNLFREIRDSNIGEFKPVWVHCASLGEFEQGRPLIEEIKNSYPDKKIIVTFFSPSGYEVRKNYEHADLVCYLPSDTFSNASKFLDLVNPSIAIFIKYEYWYNYMRLLERRSVPLFIISALFRPSQHFFQPWGGWFLKQLKGIKHFFVQDQSSAELLDKKGFANYTITGDTRFDRVKQLTMHPVEIPGIKHFLGDDKMLLTGSTWPADDKVLIEFIESAPTGMKFIIAPHEIHESYINGLIEKLRLPAEKFSVYKPEKMPDTRILIIDSIGMLAPLYSYADVAYIGGAFGSGLHNILEAVTFGKPVIFGPAYAKFPEAVELIKRGGAFSINSGNELKKVAGELLKDDEKYRYSSLVCKTFVEENLGATGKIMKEIDPFL